MSKTIDKLGEAGFFLQQMETSYLEYPAFDYFCSAFISSARSVLWIMRSEYHDVEGWESWYTSLKPSSEEQALLKRVNAARVRTEKQSPLQTKFRVSIWIPKEQATDEIRQELERYTGQTLKVSVSELDSEDEAIDFSTNDARISFLGQVEEVYRVLDELGDEDILDVGKEYYSTLSEIVAECERRFGQELVIYR